MLATPTLELLEKPLIKQAIILSEEMLVASSNLRNGLPPDLLKLLEPLIQAMFKCTHPVINTQTLEDLEESIKKILPQFTIIRMKIILNISARSDVKKIFEWIEKNLDFSRDATLQKLKKVPEKERVHEKIRLFFAVSRTILNIPFDSIKEISKEDENSLSQLFSIETYFLLILYSLLEAENLKESENLNLLPVIHHKLAEMFCQTFTHYRKILEPLARKWIKPDYSHLPSEKLWKGRPLVHIEELKKCPLPPESQ